MTKTSLSEQEEQLLRTETVARLLSVSVSTIYKWVSEGKFPAPITLSDPEDRRSASRFLKSEVYAWIYTRPRGKSDGKSDATAGTAGLREDTPAD